MNHSLPPANDNATSLGSAQAQPEPFGTVKTAMRLPLALRAQMKSLAAIRLLSLNTLYLQALSAFLARAESSPVVWLRPQALKTNDGTWCQTPLHLPADLERKLAHAATAAGVSLASVYYTAINEFIASKPRTAERTARTPGR